jgi:hypothetical protein
MNMKTDDLKFLVESAMKAPSGHNTQPWKFENIDDGIIIHPDFSRALPVVDSDNHALYISLGCAIENIIIAASVKGLESTIQYPEDAKGRIKILFNSANAANVKTDPLFDFIASRQVNRAKYSDKIVSNDDLQILNSSFKFQGISLLLLNGRPSFTHVIPLIIEATICNSEISNL